MNGNIPTPIETPSAETPLISPPSGTSKKNIIIAAVIVVVVLALVGVGFWYWQKSQTPAAPSTVGTVGTPPSPDAPAPKEDLTTAINQDLGNIDMGDLDKDFQGVDSDINSL